MRGEATASSLAPLPPAVVFHEPLNAMGPVKKNQVSRHGPAKDEKDVVVFRLFACLFVFF